MQISKMAVWEALQIAAKRREVKSKGEKQRYKHLNAEFQRIARRDKKAFPSDQCKEYYQSDFGVDHLVMSICRGFSYVVGRGCLL